MTKRFPLLAALVLLASSTVALAQDDDWEFQEDPSQKLSVAAVRYEGGQMIALQCEDEQLRLVITDLPQLEGQLHLTGTRADGRGVEQVWTPIAPGVYRSAMPGRDARFLRGGGAYSLRPSRHETAAISVDFDLPAESANLDRVLTACGWALEDDRDLLPEAYEAYLSPNMRERAGPDEAVRYYRVAANPEREVSCIVRGARLADCRADHPASARNSHVKSLLRAARGSRITVAQGIDPATLEGRVFRAIASNSWLVVVNR